MSECDPIELARALRDLRTWSKDLLAMVEGESPSLLEDYCGAWKLMEALETAERALAQAGDGWRPISEFGDNERYGRQFWHFYAKELINEDFNVLGVVEGFWQDDEGFVAAIWNNNQDCWDYTVIQPTHFRAPPAPPQEKET